MNISRLLNKTTAIELQSDWHNGWTSIMHFNIAINSKGDHPGWTFTFELLKVWFFQVSYYDIRHEEAILEDRITE